MQSPNAIKENNRTVSIIHNVNYHFRMFTTVRVPFSGIQHSAFPRYSMPSDPQHDGDHDSARQAVGDILCVPDVSVLYQGQDVSHCQGRKGGRGKRPR